MKKMGLPHRKNEVRLQVGDSQEEAHVGRTRLGLLGLRGNGRRARGSKGRLLATSQAGTQQSVRVRVCVHRLLIHWRARGSVHLSLVLQP